MDTSRAADGPAPGEGAGVRRTNTGMTPTPDGAERALGRDDTVTAEAKAETEVPLNPGIIANLVGTALKRGGTAGTTLPVTASRSRPAI